MPPSGLVTAPVRRLVTVVVVEPSGLVTVSLDVTLPLPPAAVPPELDPDCAGAVAEAVSLRRLVRTATACPSVVGATDTAPV